MANEQSTAGVKVKYIVEATAGTRPTSTHSIPNIKPTLSLNPNRLALRSRT